MNICAGTIPNCSAAAAPSATTIHAFVNGGASIVFPTLPSGRANGLQTPPLSSQYIARANRHDILLQLAAFCYAPSMSAHCILYNSGDVLLKQRDYAPNNAK
jgi:hypothetical protein